jgi:hypothetical protein
VTDDGIWTDSNEDEDSDEDEESDNGGSPNSDATEIIGGGSDGGNISDVEDSGKIEKIDLE